MNNPREYESNNVFQEKLIEGSLRKFLSLMRTENFRNEHFLDVGCGPGSSIVRTIIPSLVHFKSITGIDCSDQQISYAQKKYGTETIYFKLFDIEYDTVPDEMEGKFDHILSFNCIHWVYDKIKALNNCYKFLSPHGDISFLYILNHNWFGGYTNIIGEGTKWGKYISEKSLAKYRVFLKPHTNSTKEQVTEQINNVGFSVLFCEVTLFNYPYNSLGHFRAMLNSIDPFINEIPEALRNEYLDEVILLWMPNIVEDEEGCNLRLEMIEVHARKL